jgi:hypothetical protein
MGATALAQSQFTSLPTVVVVGEYGYWPGGASTIYDPFYSGSWPSGPGGGVPGAGPLEIAEARSMATVCSNKIPLSAAARQTTSASDVTSRWLAAQEVFNAIQVKGRVIALILGSGVYNFGVNNRRVFIVSYADGARESWLVNPAYLSSSVKLMDQPLPNSQYPNNGAFPTCLG